MSRFTKAFMFTRRAKHQAQRITKSSNAPTVGDDMTGRHSTRKPEVSYNCKKGLHHVCIRKNCTCECGHKI